MIQGRTGISNALPGKNEIERRPLIFKNMNDIIFVRKRWLKNPADNKQ